MLCSSGVLLGLEKGSLGKEHTLPDPTLPWLSSVTEGSCACPLDCSRIKEIYVLAKQGKSLRYQLWTLDSIIQSNKQLRTMDPQRANDGSRYVVPEGGVEAGLAGQALLVHTRTQKWVFSHSVLAVTEQHSPIMFIKWFLALLRLCFLTLRCSHTFFATISLCNNISKEHRPVICQLLNLPLVVGQYRFYTLPWYQKEG